MNMPKRFNDFGSKQQKEPKKKSKVDLNESDDFWNDCEENVGIQQRSSSSSDMKSNFHTPAFNTKQEGNNSIIKADVKEFTYEKEDKSKRGEKDEYVTFDIRDEIIKKKAISSNTVREEKFKQLINKIEQEENNTNAKKGRDENNGVERYNLLYEKGKIKNEMIRMMYEKNNEMRVQQELSECTFKPKLNGQKKNKNGILVKNQNKEQGSNIYARNVYWNQQKAEKITKEKNVINRQNEDLPFKPQTYKPNIEAIFKQDKNIIYDQNNRQFVERLEKARREEEEKKKRVMPDLSKVAGKWSKKLSHRSASADNSGFYYDGTMNNSMVNIKAIKRNLHDELHNFNIENNLLEDDKVEL